MKPNRKEQEAILPVVKAVRLAEEAQKNHLPELLSNLSEHIEAAARVGKTSTLWFGDDLGFYVSRDMILSVIKLLKRNGYDAVETRLLLGLRISWKY